MEASSLLNALQDVRMESKLSGQHQDAMEDGFLSENETLLRGEQSYQTTLKVGFLGLSSVIKESMKDLKDFLSNKIFELEERVIKLEEVKGRRFSFVEKGCLYSQVEDVFASRMDVLCREIKAIREGQTRLDEKLGVSEEVIEDKMSSLEEKLSKSEETKAISDRLSTLEDNVSKSWEMKSIEERLSSLEDNMFKLMELKVIEDRLSSIEDNTSKSVDMRAIEDRLHSLEVNMSKSFDMKAIEDMLHYIAENVSKSEDTKVIEDRLCCLEESMSISEEAKAIVNKLTFMEKNMPTLEDVRLIGEKLEVKITSLAEVKGIVRKLTGLVQGFLSKEASLAEHFNSTRKGNDAQQRYDSPAELLKSVESAYLPIQFDPKIKGRNVRLSNNGMCAQRIRPLEDNGSYAGVVSMDPLIEDELLEIRIEETIDAWSDCGIAFGVIFQKRGEVEGARNIFRSLKGTWAIKSSSFSTSGKSHTWKDTRRIIYNGYSLDTRLLTVGTILGVKLLRNGDLHFFFDGVDKGVAFHNVPKNVYAFFDILYNVTKISVVY